MVVIRLARGGRAKYPVYRIVAADSRRSATGKFVAILGQYNPHTKQLVVKHEEAKRFLANGAQPSNSVIKLFIKEGIEMPAWAKLKTKAPKAKEEPAAEVTAEEAAAEADDTGDGDEAAEPQAEERVAAVATEEASAAQESAQPLDHTETAADNEQAAENAGRVEEVAAEAAQGEDAA